MVSLMALLLWMATWGRPSSLFTHLSKWNVITGGLIGWGLTGRFAGRSSRDMRRSLRDLWASCQGASKTRNVSCPSAHGTPMDLWNRHSRGWVPAECLEQKMLYVYATVCTQGDFTLSRK